MKLVRKFIRLLPIIYLLFIFLVLIFGKGVWENIGTYTTLEEKIHVIVSSININSSVFEGIILLFEELQGPFIVILQWFQNNMGVDNYFIQIIFSILCYELWCSLIFLLFDVFSFIFNVAEAWLRKGEKLNE